MQSAITMALLRKLPRLCLSSLPAERGMQLGRFVELQTL